MRLPRPLRCPSASEGTRCDLPRFHPGWHSARPDGVTHYSWGRESNLRETYETDAPWVTWRWLSSDRETRVTGHMRMKMICCVCGKTEIIRPRIPRFGPVPIPEGGRHPERIAAVERHAHPDRGSPMSWALPLRNIGAHPGGLSIDALAMRLEADMNERDDDDKPWINKAVPDDTPMH